MISFRGEKAKGRFLRRQHLSSVGFECSKELQIKMLRALPGGSEFAAYLDGLGEVDGQHCVIDWKTTTCRYSVEPKGLLSLDPQLICYSAIPGLVGFRR